MEPATRSTISSTRKRVDSAEVRGSIDEVAIRAGCWFDPAEADRPVRFLERFCRLSSTRGGRGAPLRLIPWQRDFVRRLFGWRREDGTRRYRTAYLEVAKKNGKSSLFSGVSLHLLVGDREARPEVYLNAYDRDQARIVFDEAARMADASPELAGRLDIVRSRGLILDPKTSGKIKANSADVPSKDGVDASGVLFDELHRQRDRSLWDIFEHSGASRRQPLRVSLTTAGEDLEGVWHDERDASEQIDAGVLEDWSHLGVVYRARPEEDLEDPATWRKANPSLGVTLAEEEFRASLAKARRTPEAWNNFLRLRLNIVRGTADSFVAPEAWAACGETFVPDPGSVCFVGLDASTRIDLTSLVALYPLADGGFGVVARFYLPARSLEDRGRRDAANYRAWADAGHITLCEGDEVDFGRLEADVLRLAAEFDLRGFGSDPWNTIDLLQRLGKQKIPTVEVRQGFASLSFPTKELRRLVVGRRIRHGGNPVLAWNIANAVAEQDAAENLKLNKRRSRGRIDGAAALVDAIAAHIHFGPKVKRASVYETRGVLAIGA
jgi:phage terminase large subunit-like protein